MQLEVSRKFSRKVFDDGYEAINNHDHPCHHMMCRQEVEGIKPPYQLPEPFSGRRSTHRLVFVGLNPSISAGELIPLATDERDFDGYDSHYRKRFDGCNRGPDGKLIVRLANTDPHIPRLWRNIELFGRRHVPTFAGGCFSLGENALLVEIVHYKTKKGWIGKSKADQDRVLRHQFCVTGALLDELAPCVLVPMGNAATRQLCRLFALEAQSKRSVAQLMGHTLEGRRGGERVLITPIKHLSYPPPHDIQAAVGRQISRAIEREMPACRQYRKLT